MKKLIKAISVLMILPLMLNINIFADSSDVDIDDEAVTIEISSDEIVSKTADTEKKTYRIRIIWDTDANYCLKTSYYQWNNELKKYELKETDTDVSNKNNICSSITIINFSNSDISYDILFAPLTVKGKTITYELPQNSVSDKKGGSIESADRYQRITVDDEINASKQITYCGSIYYSDDYKSQASTAPMGEYTVCICKPLTLSRSELVLKEGKTVSLSANATISWSSSNSSVAKVKNGTVTAVSPGSAVITATTKTGRSAVCNVTVTEKSASYQLCDTEKYTELLLNCDTVSYSSNGSICIAYNGFIEETAYATFNEAQTFINELNGNGNSTAKVLPEGISDPSAGYWRLLNSKEDARSWAEASKEQNWTNGNNGVRFTDATTRYAGVSCLWSNISSNSSNAYYWNCDDGYWFQRNRTTSYSSYGFVVIWNNNN